MRRDADVHERPGPAPSIDILSVGTLHEAVFAFSKATSVDSFWLEVARNMRWVVAAKRVCILTPVDGARCAVAARIAGGRPLPEVSERFEPGDDALGDAWHASRPLWIDTPAERIARTDVLREWLVETDPTLLHAIPLVGGEGSRGLIVLDVVPPENEAERARTTALASLYARHAATTCSVMESTQALTAKNSELEGAKHRLVDALEEIRDLNSTLEARIEERTRELQDAQSELVDLSRRAGMAEVASEVLHNVGNVLTSVNVAANVIEERVRASAVARIGPATELLKSHAGRVDAFLDEDPRGQQWIPYVEQLAERLSEERLGILDEVTGLKQGIEHIKAVVTTQQTYTGSVDVTQPYEPRQLVEEALRMSEVTLATSSNTVERALEDIGKVVLDRHRVMQVLLNLLSNAKHAVQGRAGERRIAVEIPPALDGTFTIRVRDNGIGIPAENRDRIFNHGFTTKKDGHGFGLHNSANAAKAMGGELRCESEGPGAGATFELRLPVRKPDVGGVEHRVAS